MKKLTRFLSLAIALMMLISTMAVFASAEEGKSYTYTLDFNNILDENDYFDVFKSEWNDDYAQIASKRVNFNEVASGSGPVSNKIGVGVGFGTSELRVYKCVTDRKCYFENDGNGYTTVFKFTAPVKGTYTTTLKIPEVTGNAQNTNIFYFIGSDDAGFVKNTEGGTTQGRHDFTHADLNGVYKMTFELEKGQSIAACILSWSKIYYQVEEISVTLTNAAEEPPVITTPAETTPKNEETTPKNEETSANQTDGDGDVTTSVPDTTEDNGGDDNGALIGGIIAGVVAVAVIAVVVVVVIKKKK